MAYLLNGEDFAEYFDADYPLFYKNKFAKGKGVYQKFFYRSAIDNALKNNQVGAVKEMLKYICEYQNTVTSSYLFSKDNITEMIERNIHISDLLNSKVFLHSFDYDEWPGTHANDEELMKPYNDSIFKLRNNYETIFEGDDFKPLEDEDEEAGPGQSKKKHDSGKIYKIQYSVNLLPMLGLYVEATKDPYTGERALEIRNEDMNFLGTCAEAEEIDMFDCPVI